MTLFLIKVNQILHFQEKYISDVDLVS